MEIGLVQKVQRSLGNERVLLRVEENRIIENKFKREPILFLADRENRDHFSHLCLFRKTSN